MSPTHTPQDDHRSLPTSMSSDRHNTASSERDGSSLILATTECAKVPDAYSPNCSNPPSISSPPAAVPRDCDRRIYHFATGIKTSLTSSVSQLRNRRRRGDKPIALEECHMKGVRMRTVEPKYFIGVWKTWWMEILSSLLAIGCLIAIVIILAFHDGKPLPHWPDLISINTMVAVFTAIFKASLMMPVAEGIGQLKWDWFQRPRRLADIVLYDDATRGPWGSLMLIIKRVFQVQRTYLAGLGALITVAALAIDPISQAMIEHKRCLLPTQSANASLAEVPRANNYSAGRIRNEPVLYFSDSEPGGLLGAIMESAIKQGLIQPQETAAMINFRCPTGNCNFTGEGHGSCFSSLAICHSCQDITEQITRSDDPDISGHSVWRLHSDSFNDTNGGSTEVYSAWNSTKLSLKSTTKFWGYNEGPFVPFYSFDVLMVVNPDPNCKEGWQSSTIAIASRCRLDACVKRYNGSVQDGVYRETERPELEGTLNYDPHGHFSQEEMLWALLTKTSLVDGKERLCTAEANGAPHTVRVASVDGHRYRVGSEDRFKWQNFTMNSWQGIISTLELLLETTVTGSLSDDISLYEGPEWLKRIYSNGAGNFSTVENMARGLANSMTAAIRNQPYGDINDEYTGLFDPDLLRTSIGTTLTVYTCIYVNWHWIAHLASLLVLQWTFSVSVLLKRRSSCGDGRQRQMGWKSSPLALLFNGLDESLSQKHKDLYTLDEMNQVAESMTVQLAPASGSKGDALRFCEAKV
ncbi:hypothetical protein CNYM01_13633 [Colletotrichum nymphaeae SA-01]|uniref:Uncharacterized protein n=1 Tax=Colletotrichum nymphaeae SA-01 TaxID=1460502 RepID=A0A135UXT6_9PEZI|nr:hypothetical protein CNYM01_13633 [Colletotrichum nymphaeae SA-01]